MAVLLPSCFAHLSFNRTHVLPNPAAANVSFPTAECSTLELIQPDAWSTMDGYVTLVPRSQLISQVPSLPSDLVDMNLLLMNPLMLSKS